MKTTLTMNHAGIIKNQDGVILAHFDKECGMLYISGRQYPVTCSYEESAFEIVRSNFT